VPQKRSKNKEEAPGNWRCYRSHRGKVQWSFCQDNRDFREVRLMLFMVGFMHARMHACSCARSLKGFLANRRFDPKQEHLDGTAGYDAPRLLLCKSIGNVHDYRRAFTPPRTASNGFWLSATCRIRVFFLLARWRLCSAARTGLEYSCEAAASMQPPVSPLRYGNV
jgi:hypothetical protein